MRQARTLAFAGAMSVAATVLLAQDIVQPARGTRLRLTLASGGRRLVGTLTTLDDGALTLLTPHRTDAVVVRREGITRVEVSTGRQSRARGALLGAAIGAGAGAVIGVAGGLATSGEGEKTYGAVASGAISAFLLGSIGAGVGLVVPPAERWNELPLDRVRLTLAAVPGRGAAISVAFAF